MTIKTHPGQSLLVDYENGTLPTAAGLTVAAHIETCEACRRTAARLRELGGHLIESIAPTAVDPGALEKTLARLTERPVPIKARAMPLTVRGLPLPAAWATVGLHPPRPFGPNYWIAHTRAAAAHGWRSFLVGAPASGEIAHHRHRGEEYVAVLEGSLNDGERDYRAGDFIQSADGSAHTLKIGNDGRCVCLVAIEAPLTWSSPWVALLRPWIGV